MESARAVAPHQLFQSFGFEVKDEGRHLSVRRDGVEHYRSTIKDDGHYVHCRADESGVGDNIDLVRELSGQPDMPFVEAVYAVHGSPELADSGPQPRRHAPKEQDQPRLPAERHADREAGREYLRGRGISDETLHDAEECGFLRYCGGAVVFCGYDSSGALRTATRRMITSDPDQTSKRDLKGSQKRFAPILQGDDSSTVWVVEGGADALAVHDLSRLHGLPVPTVIVSGGAGVRSWVEERAELLSEASRIYIAHERDKDDATQAKTDAQHERQAEAVAEVTEAEIYPWRPQEENCKDLADVLLLQQEQLDAEQVCQTKHEQQL